jgi:hypothetical protein
MVVFLNSFQELALFECRASSRTSCGEKNEEIHVQCNSQDVAVVGAM